MLGEGWKLGVGVGFCVHIRKQILTLKRFIMPQSGSFLDIVNINICFNSYMFQILEVGWASLKEKGHNLHPKGQPGEGVRSPWEREPFVVAMVFTPFWRHHFLLIFSTKWNLMWDSNIWVEWKQFLWGNQRGCFHPLCLGHTLRLLWTQVKKLLKCPKYPLKKAGGSGLQSPGTS